MKVVCFGDSLTARKETYPKPMLTLMLKDKVRDVAFFNAGVSGNTTVMAKKRLTKDVLAYKPDVVTILFGSNDSATHKNVPLEVYEENLRYFIRKIGAKKVILITPPPVDEQLQMNRKNELLEQYRQVVLMLAHEYHCAVIDFFEVIYKKESYTQWLKGVQDDGLHFGEKTYDLLADLIVDVLRTNFIKQKKSPIQKIVQLLKRG